MEKLIWQDLKDAIDDAYAAICHLATFGMVTMNDDDLNRAVMNAKSELGMWHEGMNELAEDGVQDIDRDAVMRAYNDSVKCLFGSIDDPAGCKAKKAVSVRTVQTGEIVR